MANNNVLKISPPELGEIVNNLVKNKLMMISKAHPPGQPGPPNPDPSSPYLPGKSPHKLLAHGEGRGPQQKFHDEYNQPLKKPPWRHANPRGEPIDIEWQKEEYMKDHPQFFPKNKGMTISGASSRQIRDRLRPFTSGGPADYDKEGGSLRGVPNPLRIQLLRDAKA